MAILAASAIQAQTSFDAAKLFDEDLNGTARYVSMGGAMGALGSDISVISKNPAGIGTYHKSDINISLSMAGSNTGLISSPLDAKADNVKSELFGGMDNIGLVIAGGDGYGSSLNFAFSYRRLFKNDMTLTYYDAILDADGYELWRDFQDRQRNTVKSWDMNLSYNCNDVFYMGLTVGILSTDTWSEGYLYDRYERGKHPDFPNGLDYTNVDFMNSATGSGWNVALGTIFRPVPAVRFGLAVKSPTLFRQTLYYSDYLYDDCYVENGLLKENHNDPAEKFTNSVDYTLTSPWSFDFSTGLTFGHTALGFEFEGYFTGRSSLNVNNSKMAQGAVDYSNYSTCSFGIEQNIGKFSLRAGYNVTGPKFKNNVFAYQGDTDFNMKRKDCQSELTGRTDNWTCGIGFCSAPEDGTQFYADFAFIHSNRTSQFALYAEDALSEYRYTTNKCQLTLGFCF